MLPRLQDDGLLTPKVGPWAEQKYRLVSNYARTFATGMKDKWDCRAYVDLFAGTGRSRIQDTGAIVPASPILALDVPDRFDLYIFCDINKAALEALETRVKRIEPSGDYSFIVGDINQSTEKILTAMPHGSSESTALTFCLADPFKLQNLHFDTIRTMAQKFVDFLVLIPSFMDANRNEATYTSCENMVLDFFHGNTGWRSHWERQKRSGKAFGMFVSDFFGRQMQGIGYRYEGMEDMVLVRSVDNNLPLYHLAFFSRHSRGREFWQQAKKYSTDQLSMFE